MKRIITKRKRVPYSKHKTIKESEPEEYPERKLIQDTTLLIGFLTILGYYVAFSYEKGYKSYFSLPNIFLDDVNLVNVLVAMAAIGAVWLSMYLLYSLFKNFETIFYILFEKFESTNENIIYFFKKVVIFPLFIGFLLILSLPREKSAYIMVLFTVSIIIAINFIPPLFIKGTGYINKLKAYIGNEESITVERIFDVMTNNKRALIMGLVAISIITSNLASIIGYGKASKEENYLIIKEPTPYVVIDNDKDNLIIAPIDLKTQTVTPKYQIIEPKSDMENPLVFEAMRFDGGLKVKDRETGKVK